MRIVMKVRRDVNANVVLNNLYKYTALQTTFGINMLALVDGQPKVLSLKQCIQHYLDHQIEVIRRRTQFDLNKAEARAHILEGLRVAFFMILIQIGGDAKSLNGLINLKWLFGKEK